MNMYELKCSNCDTIKTYTNKRSWYNAKKRQSKCKPCQNNEASEYWTGRKKPNYPKHRRRQSDKTKFFRSCPDCDKTLYYAEKYNLELAIKKETVCDSCANYKYEKTWNDVMSESARKQMRATKAGYDSWEQYKQNYPMKKAYINKVHKLTRKQPLHLLENYDKLQENTGVMGTKGAYQIDHIKSIDKCWKDGTPPEECSDLSNLQIITWEQNIRKSR